MAISNNELHNNKFKNNWTYCVVLLTYLKRGHWRHSLFSNEGNSKALKHHEIERNARITFPASGRRKENPLSILSRSDIRLKHRQRWNKQRRGASRISNARRISDVDRFDNSNKFTSATNFYLQATKFLQPLFSSPLDVAECPQIRQLETRAFIL